MIQKIKAKENRINYAVALFMLFQALFFALVIFLTSCTSQARTQTQTRTVGVQAGQEVNLTTTTVADTSEISGVDVAAVVSAAVQASQGKILGALDAIKPQAFPAIPSVDQIASAVTSKSPQPGQDWGTLAGGGVATALGLFLAWQKSKEKKAVELDRDKIYDEHIELCKKTQPESLNG